MNGGIVLLEVMVALALVSLLVMPLATAVDGAVSRADTVRQRASEVVERTAGPDASKAWDWGPVVVDVKWHPGPVMDVRIGQAGGGDVLVGLWIDGWSLGERSVDETWSLRIGAVELGGLAGAEVVLRVRATEGRWGPPWRSVVADHLGGYSGIDLASLESPALDGERGTQASVAHVPNLASLSPNVSWTTDDPTALATGPLFGLPPSTVGRCEIVFDCREQSWLMETDRALDIYF